MIAAVVALVASAATRRHRRPAPARRRAPRALRDAHRARGQRQPVDALESEANARAPRAAAPSRPRSRRCCATCDRELDRLGAQRHRARAGHPAALRRLPAADRGGVRADASARLRARRGARRRRRLRRASATGLRAAAERQPRARRPHGPDLLDRHDRRDDRSPSFGLTALLALLDRAGRRRLRDDELQRARVRGLAHRAAEPRAVRAADRRGARPPASPPSSRSSTSTTSSRSTTRSATPPATACSRSAASACGTRCAPADTVARLGGDEFAILALGAGDPDALVDRLFDVLAAPVMLEGKRLHLRASIGIATTESGDDLLRNADLAMYAAKAAGTNRFAVFTDDMHVHAAGAAGPPRAARAGDRERGAGPALPADRRPRPRPRRRLRGAGALAASRRAACSARASSSRWPRRPG